MAVDVVREDEAAFVKAACADRNEFVIIERLVKFRTQRYRLAEALRRERAVAASLRARLARIEQQQIDAMARESQARDVAEAEKLVDEQLGQDDGPRCADGHVIEIRSADHRPAVPYDTVSKG